MDITYIVLIVQIVIGILALAFALHQISLLKEQLLLLETQIKEHSLQIQESRLWDIKKATFEYCEKYSLLIRSIDDETLKKLNLIEYRDEKQNIEYFKKLVAQDPEIEKKLFVILDYFEILCTGIMSSYFNEIIAKNILYKAVVSAYKSLSPYILIRRDASGVDVYEHFKIIALKWQQYASDIGVNT